MSASINRTIKSFFGFFGAEVRLRKNVARLREREKHEATLAPWRVLAPYQPDVILDIGANEGQFASFVSQIFPEAVIHSFEPLRDCFEKLQSESEGNANWHVHGMALGDTKGSTEINRNAYSPSSSLLDMGHLHREEYPHSTRTTKESIQIERLDDLASILQLDGNIIAKLDVQGYEDRVLRGGQATIQQCDAVVMEMSARQLYENQPRFGELYDQMRELGFELAGFVEQAVSRKDGRIVQFDGIFERQTV